MELNTYLFPAPKPSYTAKSLGKVLFYIPHKGDFRNHCYRINKVKPVKISSKPPKQLNSIPRRLDEQVDMTPVKNFADEDISPTDASQS